MQAKLEQRLAMIKKKLDETALQLQLLSGQHNECAFILNGLLEEEKKNGEVDDQGQEGVAQE